MHLVVDQLEIEEFNPEAEFSEQYLEEPEPEEDLDTPDHNENADFS